MDDKDKCPLCGSDGALALISFECSNSHCQNFHASQARKELELDDCEDDDDNYWMVFGGGTPF